MAFNRRSLFRGGSLLGLAWPRLFAAPAVTKPVNVGPTIYESIGVRPFINARGTFTILTGSQTLPEVKKAMEEASRHYVHMDELMAAVGRRLADLTQAEYGIVTAGCAAALTHATAACMCGSNPELMQRLPNTEGFAKNEVIIPRRSRNVYDHAVRMTGAKVITVDTAEEMQHALNSPRAALVMVYASPAAEAGPLNFVHVCEMAKARKVPVIVDAAAEKLTIPNKYLSRGATLVAYSGGKCMRGPQAAGLLLGSKPIVEAAWVNSAPHHAFGRSLKVGKEEIMGMLTAVEMWTRRDHDAEWKNWETWIDEIGTRVKTIPGVTTDKVMPEDLSNYAPQLRIRWDGKARGITGSELVQELQKGTPRIFVAGGNGTRPDSMASSITIMPYMLQPGEYKVVSDAVYKLLSSPPAFSDPARPTGDLAQVAGQWDVHIEFLRGDANHRLMLEQNADKLMGTHVTEFLTGDLHGRAMGREVRFQSAHRYEGTVLTYGFIGTVNGDHMEGTVALAEYGDARFTAQRHGYARG